MGRGDIVAFNHFFGLVSTHLKAHDALHDGLHVGAKTRNTLATASIEPILPMCLMPDHEFDEQSNIQPLIDMMVNDACPNIQMEAIKTLSVIATEHAKVALVISTVLANHQDILERFITSVQFEVSYPATLLAAQLGVLTDTFITVSNPKSGIII